MSLDIIVLREMTVWKQWKKKKANIEKNELIIKNRDTSHDGEFLGWFVYNRYRAKNNNNTVLFGETLLLFDKGLEQWQISYNIEKNKDANFEEVRTVIEGLLDTDWKLWEIWKNLF